MAELAETSSGDGTKPENAVPSHEERLADWIEGTIRMPDGQMASWESQAAQYPVTGPPGISYFRGQVTEDLFVDCLLYRDDNGELVGILNHYPTDIPPFQHEGDENVWVRPDRRRQGIGTALAMESSIRWTAKAPTRDAVDIRLTESGARWLLGIEGKIIGVTRVLPVPPEVVYREWLDPEGLRGWICPSPGVVKDIEIEPREGGSYRIEVDNQGSEHCVTGQYLVLDPLRALAFSWRSSAWDPSVPDSWVNVSLEPHAEGRTLMTLRHGQLVADLRPGYVAVWERVALQLEDRLTER